MCQAAATVGGLIVGSSLRLCELWTLRHTPPSTTPPRLGPSCVGGQPRPARAGPVGELFGGFGGTPLLEQQDEWAVQRHYMPLETMPPISDTMPTPARLPIAVA